jgi:peptidylprolyl isomerase
VRRGVALAVVPLLLFSAACAGEDGEGEGDGGSVGSIEGVEVSGEFGEEPEVSVSDLKVEELESVTVTEGDGTDSSKDQQTLVDFVLVNGTTGDQVFSTYAQQPVAVGPQQPLFPGFLESLDGKQARSRVAVATTVDEAFSGQTPQGLELDAEDSMVAVADILSVQPQDPLDGPEGDPVEAPASTPKVIEEDGDVTGLDWAGTPQKPGKELQVVTLVEGEGPEIESERLVTFDYFGQVYRGKEPFDESYSRDPATFPLGIGGLIPAWDESLVGVKTGSRVLIIAPPDKAYGEQGNPPSIPANATLAFVIDVLGVDA